MGSTKVESPAPPVQPSSADAINAYIAGLPQIYQAQLEYAPKEAAQQVALAQQYALPMGEAYKTAQEAMYPGTSAIQENLANQSLQGMQTEVPDWMKQEYLSNLNSQLGANVGSGIAADYASRGLLQQQQDWKQYYQNLGLAVSGRQPLSQPTTPSYTNMMQNYTPQSVMSFMGQNYGNYTGAFSSMYNANANRASARDQMYGQIISGAAGGAGMAMACSKDFKQDIKDNDVDSIDIIKKLNVKKFTYKPDMNLGSKEYIGVIAEECPDAILTEDKKHVSLIDTIGILLDTNKKLIERIEKLENR